MSSENVIELKNVSKVYKLYHKPIDRLFQMLPWNKNRKLADEYWALKNIDLQIQKGDVIGLVGQNGAGKSTLLQLVCKTLEPSSGNLHIEGKIAALLELGSGFNPEFTGRENVYMSGAIAGLKKHEIDKKYDAIVAFSGIGEHVNNPVKTYSSGMMVRLAFAVATSVEPEILVIDEALSVGDGAFARKSFDKIMELKESGCTILFCSHSLYQVEVLCNKVMWIDKGEIQAFGEPAGVVNVYQKYLDNIDKPAKIITNDTVVAEKETKETYSGNTRIKGVKVSSDEPQEGDLKLVCDESTLNIDISFVSSTSLDSPSVAVIITDDAGKNITSCSTFYDGITIELDSNGEGNTTLIFPKIGLRRGRYHVHVFLMCEKAIHIYESVECASLDVTQRGSELGVVSLPRSWS